MDSKLQKDKRLRFGIMGAANIAKKNAIAIVTSDSCEFAAIASRDRAKAEAFLTNNGLSSSNAKVYTSYEDLLADDSIDAVYIPLPTLLHLEWVKKAAAAKKHILVEKPVAVNSEELAEMMAACQENGVLIMDGTMFVHHQRMDSLTTFLRHPLNQQVSRMQAGFSFHGDEDFFKNNIRGTSGMDPLGALGDLGWYCIRMALIAFSSRFGPGDVIKVNANPLNKHSDRPGSDLFDLRVDLRFCDAEGNDRQPPVVCSFDCSFQNSFQQYYRLNLMPPIPGCEGGLDKVVTCSDFVIPRSTTSASYDIESIGGGALEEYATRVMSTQERVEMGQCCQEQRMFDFFAQCVFDDFFAQCVLDSGCSSGAGGTMAKLQSLQKDMVLTTRIIDAAVLAMGGETVCVLVGVTEE